MTIPAKTMLATVSRYVRRCTLRDGTIAEETHLVVPKEDVEVWKAIEAKLAQFVGRAG